jgi:sugar O-acyltransferase (sialic acid O-acetyltransferase NeuD family)
MTNSQSSNYSNANKCSHLLPLVIFGAGGHAVSVANVALSAGYTLKHFVDKNRTGQNLLGISIISDLNDLDGLDFYCYGIAVGDNAVRERIYNNLKIKYANLKFPPLVHASATVSLFTSIGDGTVVMPKAVIGPNSKIGNFCILNTLSSIDHDCLMLDFSSLAPAAVTGGSVQIGLRSVVSIGATIKHGLKIGHDSVVGANSYLSKDLPDNQLAYGTPAKYVRSRNIGDSYLK